MACPSFQRHHFGIALPALGVFIMFLVGVDVIKGGAHDVEEEEGHEEDSEHHASAV